ncbi:LGALS8 isoform 19 [Pan troglodytes]|uniref:LGALS8 isoform 19 n=1 Tax=Pan troglodytes TaxID=9598 RepID=A0A2J8M6Y1_PANTR|nr:LGALS8 isoform 19 [Pan troglodytes]
MMLSLNNLQNIIYNPIPGGSAEWQQRETSSRCGLSFQSSFQKGRLHCLQYLDK